MMTRQKERKNNKRVEDVKRMLAALFIGYLVTMLGIVIVAICLLILPVSETMVDMGVLFIYFFSCVVCGFHAGKRENHDLRQGIIAGVVYELLLLLLSFVLHGSWEKEFKVVMSLIILCMISGGVGAMFSRKNKRLEFGSRKM